MTSKPKKLSDQLRRAIEQSNVTRYRMSQDLHITEGQLSRFVNGKCGLSIASIDAISEYLRLEITMRK
jgi:predicted XRE-type DNA-binding protein